MLMQLKSILCYIQQQFFLCVKCHSAVNFSVFVNVCLCSSHSSSAFSSDRCYNSFLVLFSHVIATYLLCISLVLSDFCLSAFVEAQSLFCHQFMIMFLAYLCLFIYYLFIMNCVVLSFLCFSVSQTCQSSRPEELHLLAESERRGHCVCSSGFCHVQSSPQTAVILTFSRPILGTQSYFDNIRLMHLDKITFIWEFV